MDEAPNMFTGLLKCADCGHNLHYHFNQGNPEIKYFNCSNYKGNRGTCPSTHYVRLDFLERVVMGEIRRLTRYATKHETDFVAAMEQFSNTAAQECMQRKRKDLNALVVRDKELDVLFERLYEDKVNGDIPIERYRSQSARYDKEQAELKSRIKTLRLEVEKEEQRALTTENFIAIVRKYTRTRKLTPRMLNELIERTEVYHVEKIEGVHVQRLVIHYNCIGTIAIPEELDLPKPQVVVQTRKGVAVSYEPCIEGAFRLQGEKKMMCAIYCRVNHHEPDPIALEQQKQALLDYAKQMGYTETAAYLDNGYSGRTLDRPAMKQLNADIQAGTVNAVIVKDPSRVARDVVQCSNWFDRMDRQGVTVLCRDNPGFQKERLELQGAFAELYKRKKRKQERHTVRTPPPQNKAR